MKKIILLLAVVLTAGLQSCMGPEGIPGQDGQNGYSAEAEVFEVTTTFSAANNFSRLVPLTPAILSSDMVLVYRLYGTDGGDDVWRLIPQTVYLAQGEFDYNYDFTKNDISIFLDSDFDMNTLTAEWVQNQTFRIVIIPGYFSKGQAVDMNDYDAVIKAYHINEQNIKTLK